MRRMSLLAHENLPEDWERTQYVAFRSFINHTMRREVVDELERDLNDGVVLYKLMETLLPGSMKSVKIVDPPPNEFQRLANCEAVIEGITTVVHLTNFGGRDLWSGNLKLIMGLLWSLIYRFRIAKQQDEGGEGQSPKNFFIEKLRAAVEPFSSIEMPTNLTNDLKDGRVLAALLHSFNPHVIDPENLQADTATEAIELIQTHFEALGVPSIISAQDIAEGNADEKATLLYISYLHEAFDRADAQVEVEAEKDGMAEAMSEAVSLVPRVASMSEEEMRRAFTEPRLLELMFAVRTQLILAASQHQKSQVSRGSRASLMQQMLVAGVLPRAQQVSILESCAQRRSGVSQLPRCNVCAGLFIGDGARCFGCGLRVHPTCLQGMKPVSGHLLKMPLCVLCATSEKAVPADGYGWQPKETVVRCTCGREFGLARWKHRCRSCGGVRCDACSSRRSLVPGFEKPERVCLSCLEDTPREWLSASSSSSSSRGPRRLPASSLLSPRQDALTEQICALPGPALCALSSKDARLFYVGLSDEVFIFEGDSWTHESVDGRLEALCVDSASGCVLAGGTHVSLLYPQVKPLLRDACVCCLGVDGELLLCGHQDGTLTEHLLDGSLQRSVSLGSPPVCLAGPYASCSSGIFLRSSMQQVHPGGALAMLLAGGRLWAASRDSCSLAVISTQDHRVERLLDTPDTLRCLAAFNGTVYGGADGIIICWNVDTMEKTGEYAVKGVVSDIALRLDDSDDGEIVFIAGKCVNRVKI